jgi:hypothetical protein
MDMNLSKMHLPERDVDCGSTREQAGCHTKRNLCTKLQPYAAGELCGRKIARLSFKAQHIRASNRDINAD